MAESVQWSKFAPSFFRRRSSERDGVYVRFTGAPTNSASEELIHAAIGERESVSLNWLEERLADLLYQAELGKGGWVVDVGIWGPAIYRQKAARLVADARSKSGFLETACRMER